MDNEGYRELRLKARRLVHRAGDADDLLQDTLVAALEAGRDDPAWMHGVMRKLAAMQARTAVRRRQREAAVALVPGDDPSTTTLPVEASSRLRELLASMPPAARRVAVLALHGLAAEEIRWILGVSDTAFRQRLTSIRKSLATAGLSAGEAWAAIPGAGPSRCVDLQYGLLRRALKAAIDRRPGLGTHDADGHLIVLGGPAHRSAPGGN